MRSERVFKLMSNKKWRRILCKKESVIGRELGGKQPEEIVHKH